jgi:glucokinase
MGTPATTRLVGDIGGTNTRLALFDEPTHSLHHIQSYTNREFDSLESVIERWIADLPEEAPANCCLAVASPPFDDVITMINMDWSFSISGLAQKFGFANIRCINDFEGNAFALPHLAADDRVVLRSASKPASHKLAVVGPGTGLGGATLDYYAGTPIANASEPGHISLGPGTQEELAVFELLLSEHSDIYAELLLCGPGLPRIYQSLARVRGEPTEDIAPPQVLELGVNNKSSLAKDALSMFCALLGSLCGDYVLATGSYGGLYLAGGILPRMVPFLEASGFCQRFDNKGEMGPHMAQVPLYAITTGSTGLIGAAHAPLK